MIVNYRYLDVHMIINSRRQSKKQMTSTFRQQNDQFWKSKIKFH